MFMPQHLSPVALLEMADPASVTASMPLRGNHSSSSLASLDSVDEDHGRRHFAHTIVDIDHDNDSDSDCDIDSGSIELTHVPAPVPKQPVALVVDGCVLDAITSDYDDIFSLETFPALAAQRAQGLVIARVCTRDPTRVSATAASYYDAVPLLKLLYPATTATGVRHRYHSHCVHQPVNPLTNSAAVGEVMFFHLSCTNSSSHTQYQGTRHLVAQYLGTDYHYTFNRDFRAKINGFNCDKELGEVLAVIDAELCKPMVAPTAVIAASADTRPQSQSVSFLSTLGTRFASPDAHTIGMIAVPFARAAVYGVVWSFYGLVAFLVFEANLSALINGDAGAAIDLGDQWWLFLLPFLSGLVDTLTSMLFWTREAYAAYAVKAILVVLYVLTPMVLFGSSDDNATNTVRRCVLLVSALAAVTYSGALFCVRWRRTRLE